MSRTKRILSLVMVMVFMFTTAMMTGMTAFAAEEKTYWTIGAAGGGVEVGLHVGDFYKDSRYSIAIMNNKEGFARLDKEVSLELSTTYKFSAWVKTTDYKLGSSATVKESGAYIQVHSVNDGITYRLADSKKVTKDEWTKLECTFKTSADKDEKYFLRIYSGDEGAEVKGTGWFSDVKLEKETSKGYKLVSDDMMLKGADVSAFALKISKVTAEKIADQVYTGKKIKPEVVLKDGNYTLKKNVDYTVSYKNNKKVGTATVTIKGKGIYTGKKTIKFKIVKKKTTVSPPAGRATLTVTWDEVKGAGKYEVWGIIGGGELIHLKTVEADKDRSCTVVHNPEWTYQFAVRAYITATGEYTDFGYITA